MRPAIILTSLLFMVCCAHGEAGLTEPPVNFVRVSDVVPGLVEDMRYHTAENFVGAPVDGYEAPVCWLTEPAAKALSEVQAQINDFGLGLKVFDCYRPARAVSHFARWAADLEDQKTKSQYYPHVDKSELFERGYIAERSGHSRGSTMDITLIALATGEEVDMGSPFDLFDELSWPSDPRPTAQQRANRLLLQSVMSGHGFRGLKEEWWHFTLNDEPYPDTYFDFVVK